MRWLCCTALLSVIGCVKQIPPQAAAPRAGTPVAASFGKTWDAVIDRFAERNIPIRTIDRSSGIISADPLTVERVGQGFQAHALADCGRTSTNVYYQPTLAIYNVLVRGDSSRSTVKATVRFTSASGDVRIPPRECETRGSWESDFEEVIRARAEDKAAKK